MDASVLMAPAECPPALRKWADTLIGRKWGDPSSKRGRRVVAGWRWDGVSDEIVLIVAPQGTRSEEIPPGVWRRMHGGRS